MFEYKKVKVKIKHNLMTHQSIYNSKILISTINNYHVFIIGFLLLADPALYNKENCVIITVS